MPKSKRNSDVPLESPKKRRAISPEARENDLISLAMDEAERQIREGTASSQIITHFLKLGTQKEMLEREKIEYESRLLQAKIEGYETAKNIESLYSDAIKAMQKYGGHYSEEGGDI